MSRACTACSRSTGASSAILIGDEATADQVGTTPIAYVLAWRMALAKDALIHSDQTIDEIARDVGYGSASAFSDAFHRFTGSRPGRDRRLVHASGDAASKSATSTVNRRIPPDTGWRHNRQKPTG